MNTERREDTARRGRTGRFIGDIIKRNSNLFILGIFALAAFAIWGKDGVLKGAVGIINKVAEIVPQVKTNEKEADQIKNPLRDQINEVKKAVAEVSKVEIDLHKENARTSDPMTGQPRVPGIVPTPPPPSRTDPFSSYRSAEKNQGATTRQEFPAMSQPKPTATPVPQSQVTLGASSTEGLHPPAIGSSQENQDPKGPIYRHNYKTGEFIPDNDEARALEAKRAAATKPTPSPTPKPTPRIMFRNAKGEWVSVESTKQPEPTPKP